MAKKPKSKCKFIVYHTHGDKPPAQRVVTEQPFSHAGWSRANRQAREVALGIDKRFGKGKTDTFLEVSCDGHEMPLVNCTPDFGKELCWPYTVDDRNYPSTRELAGRRVPGRPRRLRRPHRRIRRK